MHRSLTGIRPSHWGAAGGCRKWSQNSVALAATSLNGLYTPLASWANASLDRVAARFLTRCSRLATLVSPELERAMRGDSLKVTIRRQQRQLVTDAKLREQGIDGADLHSGAPATIA